MPTLLAKHALIICTKDRSEVLNEQVKSFLACDFFPEQLILVDASESFDRLHHQKRYESLLAHFTCISASPHLPAQRNLGLQLLSSEIQFVHFLDDDFFPKPNYFTELNRCFLSNPSIFGFGALIKQDTVYKPRFFDPKIPGTIAINGRTLDAQVYPLSQTELFPTHYLSGCSMSFRRTVFNESRFNENLRGYAQDEDLDFCIQLNKELAITPFTSGFHNKSEQARISRRAFKKSAVINRYSVLNNAKHISFRLFDFLAVNIIQLGILCLHPIKNKEHIFGQLDGLATLLKADKH
ncbi:hypothetical protein EP331_05970 [bacterium]|nr:MAG: hypothetical protein EP331_05970 [bacterium]